MDPLLGKALEINEYSRCYAIDEKTKGPFLSNGSVNTFPRIRTARNNRRMVFSM
jgi:hypothetical protein